MLSIELTFETKRSQELLFRISIFNSPFIESIYGIKPNHQPQAIIKTGLQTIWIPITKNVEVPTRQEAYTLSQINLYAENSHHTFEQSLSKYLARGHLS